MITGIVFSNFVSIKPPKLIGVATGYAVKQQPLTVVPVYKQTVNLNG